jgi:transcriptional regulator with XRE-family HTH domain
MRRRREACGMTLAELAKRSGLTANYISRVEAGEVDPSISTMKAVIEALGLTPGEFFGSDPEITAPGEEAARLWNSALPEVQEAILEILRGAPKDPPE